MANTKSTVAGAHPEGATRRDFLTYATAGVAAAGAVMAVWPFIDSMNPATDVIAAGGPIDVDISKLAPGQQIVVLWRSMPIFVVSRTPDAVKLLDTDKARDLLRDPDSEVHQQPAYAENSYRSAKAEILVLVGICTHLGCIPRYFPTPSATDPAPDWQGGFFCPCHGSKYDLAGRVFKGVPAPYNLPVPPYQFVDDKTLRIGENPAGAVFDVATVVQI